MIPHRQAGRKSVEDGTIKFKHARTVKIDRCREVCTTPVRGTTPASALFAWFKPS